jgi:dTDP-4-amino-4,6-dideoxygalactose transaminase
VSARSALPAAGRSLAADLSARLRGRRGAPPGFVGMTLEREDVALARAWLADPACWEDPEPVARYEAAFAAWNGSPGAVAFASGRAALAAVLRALALPPGAEVVVPGYTCVAVPDAVRAAGLTPVFADIELETFGLDAARLPQRLGPRSGAVVLQHLYGLVARDALEVIELARRRGLPVVEDCAQSTGAALAGVRVGNRGDAAVYSSERSKVFTTMQGGLAVARDAAVAERLRALRDAAPPPEPARTRRLLESVRLRFALHRHPARALLGPVARARLAALEAERSGPGGACAPGALAAPLAALGLAQLARTDAYARERRRAALRWGRWCDARGYARPLVLPDSVPVFLRYPVLVEPARKRDLAWALRELGVRPGLWFETPIHPTREPAPDCPAAEEAAQRCINLPCLGVG